MRLIAAMSISEIRMEVGYWGEGRVEMWPILFTRTTNYLTTWDIVVLEKLMLLS
jgi:hypothetical protein